MNRFLLEVRCGTLSFSSLKLPARRTERQALAEQQHEVRGDTNSRRRFRRRDWLWVAERRERATIVGPEKA